MKNKGSIILKCSQMTGLLSLAGRLTKKLGGQISPRPSRPMSGKDSQKSAKARTRNLMRGRPFSCLLLSEAAVAVVVNCTEDHPEGLNSSPPPIIKLCTLAPAYSLHRKVCLY